MTMKRIIEYTADGSRTLYVPELDEHYHSIKGAMSESQHIFIQLGFQHCTAPSTEVLEVGFGTGLNAYLTLQAAAREQRFVRYTTLERYPLDSTFVEQLEYADDPLFRDLHTAEWEKEIALTPYFHVEKQQCDFTSHTLHTNKYDIVYFDAFAPEKQPEMWSLQGFQKLYTALRSGGILTTYCAKGVVRRMLQDVGFTVERLPGPPQGKREVLRATKG